ncbi:MAG: indole-3-glycerol phosphate synthase TrpC [Deltaproteobacteria bacterium]|nr:indole-3-glycerol phosphate synthase TrpC [Deltaproteobacteria bacterium]
MKNLENSILEKIIYEKANEVSTHKYRENISTLKAKILDADNTLSFKDFLNSNLHPELPKTRIIAEIKKASPSVGLIRENFDPKAIAKDYLEAGAAAISVLTDVTFFQGSLQDLQDVRSVCHRPILRKDFMIDPYQIYQARAYGADCILGIVAVLEKQQMEDFCGLARELGMHTLVEVHNQEELIEALQIKNDSLILGINNRNLKTLKMDLKISERLKTFIPSDLPVICESGISQRSQIEYFEKLGFSGFLIGEHLLKKRDIQKKLKELLCPKL